MRDTAIFAPISVFVPELLGQVTAMTWVSWALLSAFFAALTAILAKVGVTGVDPNLATAVRTTVVLVFTWALFFALAPVRSLGTLQSRNWVFLVLSGLATGLSWVCYFRALHLGEASRVAPVDKLSVVFVVVMAAVFLHEKVSWAHWAGGFLILAGAALLAWKI